jgi:hypothetical protein
MAGEMKTSRGVAGEILAALGDVTASSRSVGAELRDMERSARDAERDARDAEREARRRESDLKRLRSDIERREKEAGRLEKKGETSEAERLRGLASADRERLGRAQRVAEEASAEASRVRERTDRVTAELDPRRQELKAQKERNREIEAAKAAVKADVQSDVGSELQGMQMQLRGAIARAQGLASGQIGRDDLEGLGGILQTGGAALARGGSTRAGALLSKAGGAVAGVSGAALAAGAAAGAAAWGAFEIATDHYEGRQKRAEMREAVETALRDPVASGVLGPREVRAFRERTFGRAQEIAGEIARQNAVSGVIEYFGGESTRKQEFARVALSSLTAREEVRARFGDRAAQQLDPDVVGRTHSAEIWREVRNEVQGSLGYLGWGVQAAKELFNVGTQMEEMSRRRTLEMVERKARGQLRAAARRKSQRTLRAGYQADRLAWGHMLRAHETDRLMRAQTAPRY